MVLQEQLLCQDRRESDCRLIRGVGSLGSKEEDEDNDEIHISIERGREGKDRH